MLVVGGRPGDLVQVHAIFGLKNSSRPEARRDRVTAVDGDRAAFQIFWFCNSRLHIVEDGPVMEISGEKNWNGRNRLSIGFRTKVSGPGHLTDIEFEAASHASHRGDDGIHLDIFELTGANADSSVLQGLGEPVIADRDGQRRHWRNSGEIRW